MQKKDRLSSNQMLAINMIASAITYIVTFGISFFLSPYIVRTVGVDAYGFIGLANNFVSYASLAAVALNALAGRFITVKLVEKDTEGANRYCSSVFFANSALALLILLVEAYIWIRLDSLINIPSGLLWDVKILFATLFINCVISTVGTVFSVSTFATNKLYLASLRTIESSLLRALILIGLFAFFTPHVWYLGVTTLITSIYCLVFNIHYTRRLTPELHISIKSFDKRTVAELLSSGVWAQVNRLGTLLLDGLDLLITNLFIDAASMGILSLAKTVPAMIQGIVGSMVGAFAPNFTILYAKGQKEELVKAVKQSMKIMGVLANFPIIVLVVCGTDFFKLWQPTQDARQLQILSVLTVSVFSVSGGINAIYNIFTVVNKLKINSIAVIISGTLSALITFLLVRHTTIGIYAVAGTSTVISILRNFVVTIPYGAKCLGLKWYAFYSDALRPVLYFAISVAIATPITVWVNPTGWLTLVAKGVCVSCIALVVGLFIVLNKYDRQLLKRKLIRN